MVLWSRMPNLRLEVYGLFVLVGWVYRVELSTGGRGRHLFWVGLGTQHELGRIGWMNFWATISGEFEYDGVSMGVIGNVAWDQTLRYMV